MPTSRPLLKYSVSYDDYESFPRSTHYSVFTNEKESWSSPENKSKLKIVCLCSLLLGLSTAAFGQVLTLLQLHLRHAIYFGDFRIVSLVLAPLIGLTLSGLSNIWLHRRFGIRGLLLIGFLFLATSYFNTAYRQSYLSYFATYSISSFGYGLLNTCISTWIGTFEDTLYSLSVIQSWNCFGGILAAALFFWLDTTNHQTTFSVVLAIFTIALLSLIFVIFKDEDGPAYTFRIGYEVDIAETKQLMRDVLGRRPLYGTLFSLFMAYGLQIAGSTWLPTYVYSFPPRNVSPQTLTFFLQTTYWAGLTTGSLALGRLADRFKSIAKFSASYIIFSICFTMLLLAMQFTNTITVLVPVFFTGFFIGPLQPLFMTYITLDLPEYLHLTAVSMVVSAAQTGLSVVPFALGMLPCVFGFDAFLPAFVFLLFLLLAVWCAFTLRLFGIR